MRDEQDSPVRDAGVEKEKRNDEPGGCRNSPDSGNSVARTDNAAQSAGARAGGLDTATLSVVAGYGERSI